MADKKKREAEWAKAKRVCRLNAETVRMAKELGLRPRSLMKNIPSKSQLWKAPVHVWVRDMYEAMQEKAARKRARKQAEQAEDRLTGGKQHTTPVGDATDVRPAHDHKPDQSQLSEAKDEPNGTIDDTETDEDGAEVFDDWYNDDPPDDTAIEQQNQALLRGQQRLRVAAEYVTRALARLPVIRKVVLFGSVAVPLKKEVPRFREFRKAGIKVWHECKDVDLAVWVSDLANLRSLQRARSQALTDLLAEKNIGVAHHQVEMFLMEPGTDRYLGRLCCFGACPKGKPDCLVPGCGSVKFLKQHSGFVLHRDALAVGRTLLLYDAERISGDDQVYNEEVPF